MFYDMALLVEEQGEMINHIEFNVENAADHVELGREHIEKAVPFHKKNIRVINNITYQLKLTVYSILKEPHQVQGTSTCCL